MNKLLKLTNKLRGSTQTQKCTQNDRKNARHMVSQKSKTTGNTKGNTHDRRKGAR